VTTAGFGVGDTVTLLESYRFDDHRLISQAGGHTYRPNQGTVARITARSVYVRWPGAMGVGSDELRHDPTELVNLSRRGEA
jgi:hypothetical protein